jgi:hypothetical protein
MGLFPPGFEEGCAPQGPLACATKAPYYWSILLTMGWETKVHHTYITQNQVTTSNHSRRQEHYSPPCTAKRGDLGLPPRRRGIRRTALPLFLVLFLPRLTKTRARARPHGRRRQSEEAGQWNSEPQTPLVCECAVRACTALRAQVAAGQIMMSVVIVRSCITHIL